LATLVVRPLSPRDLPALRHVRHRAERLDLPAPADPLLPGLAQDALALLPAVRDRAFVALVDGELCALVVLRPHERLYRWDVVRVAAGSPRLDATDDVCQELWAALLEFAIRRAGETGARRLLAAADEFGAAFVSLRSTGFEPYMRFAVVSGTRPDEPFELPAGMRPQHPSDVWSVHQLYHQVAPKPVQYAEALTSSSWELPHRSLSGRLQRGERDAGAYVLETMQGIEGYCRIDGGREVALVQLMLAHACHEQAVRFVLAAVNDRGLGRSARIRVVIPAWAGELVGRFESAGFVVECERVALVRHTTASARVQLRVAPLPAEVGERVPRGVPTYLRGVRGVASRMECMARATHAARPWRTVRMERVRN
jgi:hypothetical protein